MAGVRQIARMASKSSRIEELLASKLDAVNIPYEREYRFAAIACGGTGKGCRERLRLACLKDWRFDFMLRKPDCIADIADIPGIAVEVEGGAWSGGRHTRGKGFHDDLIKYSSAMRLGWMIYRCDADMIRSHHAIQTICNILTPAQTSQCRTSNAA